MRNRVSAAALGFFAVAPFIAIACGGKIAPDTSVGASVATSDNAPAPSSTWPPCPADSNYAPVRGEHDKAIVDLCTRFCNRAFDCVKCTYGSCMASCLADTAGGECGAKAVTWMTCTLSPGNDHCGVSRGCLAEYCDYFKCGSTPGVSDGRCP